MKTARNIPFSAAVLVLGAMVVLVFVSFIVNLDTTLTTGLMAVLLAMLVVMPLTGFLYWVARELEENEERLRVFVESAYDGILTTDASGYIETVNPSVTSLFGYRPGQLIGEHISVLLSSAYGERHENESLRAYLAREQMGELGVPHEVRGLRQDGRQFHLDMSVNHAHAGTEEFYAVMVRDVTARVAALKVLRQAKEELEKRVKERTAALEATNQQLEVEVAQRVKLIEELQSALSQIKTLSGLLPICAACKKIRDDTGYWSQIEVYIRDHSDAEFSHGICPDCVRELYPELNQAELDS